MEKSPLSPFLFKKAEEGYVFRAPSLFLFGAGHYYKLTDAQTAKIQEALALSRPKLRGALIGVFVLCAGAGAGTGAEWLTGRTEPRPWDIPMVVAILAGLMLLGAQAFAVQRYIKLRPLLAGLPETQDRISPREIKAAASGMRKERPLTELILAASLTSVSFAFSMFIAGMEVERSFAPGHSLLRIYTPLLIALVFAGLTFFHVRLALRTAETLEKRIAAGPA